MERMGSLARRRFLEDAFGSILSVYLRDDNRVVHRGRWTTDRDGDRVVVQRFEVEGDRQRRADLVLTPVAAADGLRLVVLGGEA